MVCNKYIKLGLLIDFVRSKGADLWQAGHYTQMKDGILSMGDDAGKDQVYFLSQMKKDNLKYLKFPIGNLEKTKSKGIGSASWSKSICQKEFSRNMLC